MSWFVLEPEGKGSADLQVVLEEEEEDEELREVEVWFEGEKGGKGT